MANGKERAAHAKANAVRVVLPFGGKKLLQDHAKKNDQSVSEIVVTALQKMGALPPSKVVKKATTTKMRSVKG
jgi:hypothetical protein